MPRGRNPEAGQPSAKPRRSRVSGHRDITNVLGKSPEYYYRWVRDSGTSIHRHIDAGFSFVTQTEDPDIQVGEAKVGKYGDKGNVFRLPFSREAPDEWLYLMKQPMEFRDEDLRDEERERLDAEKRDFNRKFDPENTNVDDFYGEIKHDYSANG